jgi:hypothetical protein
MQPFSLYTTDQVEDDTPLRPLDIVRDILREAESLPQLMEVHYLAQEPGLIEIMRGLIALPEDERFRLQHYLACRRGRRLHVGEAPNGALLIEALDETRRDESA